MKRVTPSKNKMNATYHHLMDRCYDSKTQERQPTYIGAEVCDLWKYDMYAFYDFMSENYYVVGDEIIDLDKDILIPGNKLYSPDTCVFAPAKINRFFENRGEPIKKIGDEYIPALPHYYKLYNLKSVL